MKSTILTILFIVSTIICFGQSLFFNNLNNSTWTSTANLSDSIIKNLKQIPLSRLFYSKDSINKDVTVWNFKDNVLTIVNYSHQKKSESLIATYKYQVYPDKGILKIILNNNEILEYEAGITSTGNYAFLKRASKNKKTKKILFKSSALYNDSSGAMEVKKMKTLYIRYQISVTLPDKEKLFFSLDTIWGYQAYGNTYRYIKNENRFIRVAQIDSIIIYERSDDHYPMSRSTTYYHYFSKTLDSEVFYLNKKNIAEQFSGDTCFLNKIEQLKDPRGRYQLNSFDKGGTYTILNFYKSCHSQ